MKTIRIYHIDFARDIDSVVWEYSTLPENDRILLSNIQFVDTFDYQDKMKTYNFIVLAEAHQMNKYLEILQNNLILHFVHDWTNKYLRDQLNFEKIETNLDQSNLKLWKKFRTKLEDWLLENQDLDNVLDNINSKGLENLRETDKKFLENYGR